MTATAHPRPPATRLVYVDEQTEVDAALAHRVLRRSSQALATALLEVTDAATAVRALCPLGQTDDLPTEVVCRAHAAQRRLDDAIIRAVAAGATTHDITARTKGTLR